MLDSLLGRSSFYSKCKSLIKQTRTRIEVVRRKLNAKQKFFRKDIADLLENRLDSNAFGRADGLIAELILSSCYEFIDHVCEIVLKHLPVLEKLRNCPEDCREAVASLMFAAARLSDLPELRDLRNLFQERYGSSLEFYVNQKLVDNITVKPPSVEQKIQLLQDIASEFSIRWDSKKFLETMSSSDTEQARNSPGTLHLAKNKFATPPAVVTVQKAVKDESLTKKLSDANYQNMKKEIGARYQRVTQSNSVPVKKDDLTHKVSKSPDFTSDKKKPPSYREETILKDDRGIYLQRREHKAGVRDLIKNTGIEDNVSIDNLSHGRRQHHVPETDLPNTLYRQKPDSRPTTNAISLSSPVYDEIAEDGHVKPVKKQLGDMIDGSKSNFRGGIPPPYVKPRKNKHKADDENDTLTFKPADNLRTKTDSPSLRDGASSSENGDEPACFTEIYYKDEGVVDSTARRRSHRRKHSRSPSMPVDEVNGEERVIRRVSTSRRKNESKSGLKIVLGDDDGHYKKDKEERMIDKLLLHYSKKPSSIDPGNLRRKTNSSKSPHHHATSEINVDEDLTLTKSKSFCLPSRQDAEPKQEKVFMRAASFDQQTPAKHVHPKLPDYDDIAARFAALRAAKNK